MINQEVGRRTVVLGGGTLAAGVVLSACVVQQPTVAEPPAPVEQQPPNTGSAQESPPATPAAEPAPDTLAQASEVPAGGGVVLKDQEIVVTRDEAGAPHAFSAVCTHQGCLVTSVGGGTINCKCHGSKFDLASGEPVGGPAKKPLSSVAVVERNGTIVKAQEDG